MDLIQLTVPPMPHYMMSGLTEYGPGYRHVSRSNIQVFDLLFVLQGCLFIGEEDRHYEVSEGCALILRPDCYHYATESCREPTSYYWLHFQTTGRWSTAEIMLPLHRPDNDEDRSWLTRSFSTQTFQFQVPQFARLLQPGKLEETLGQLALLQQSDHLSGVRWKQQILFQETLQLLSASTQSQGSSPRVACAEQAAAYLRSHYRDEVSAKALGESLNFHPVYIARCMQKEFGCSPVEYVLRYRIEQAKLLLLQTDYTISRIAEEVGFNQATYFTSCFSKYERISPRKYRQRFAHG
jgi:AraC-like DNA-binding protein